MCMNDMTAEQLRNHFNREFENKEWPTTYEVSPFTYADVCDYIFKNIDSMMANDGNVFFIELAIGPNNGIIFKNVELILQKAM